MIVGIDFGVGGGGGSKGWFMGFDLEIKGWGRESVVLVFMKGSIWIRAVKRSSKATR